MPYQFTGASLAAAFVAIWAFIGLMMVRDQLIVVRRQRLNETGYDPPHGVSRSKREAATEGRRAVALAARSECTAKEAN